MKNRISKKLIKIICIGTPVLALFILTGLYLYSVKRLANHNMELERLKSEAERINASAVALMSGPADLKVVLSNNLVAQLLGELKGYEQVTNKGNFFKIHDLKAQFLNGYASLTADAEFKWRWGFYDGPIEATYIAFVRVGEDGSCHLVFRIAGIRPKDQWRLLDSWLSPYLTVRLQEKLRISNLRLPLGLKEQIKLNAIQRTLEEHNITVDVPERVLDLNARKPRIVATPEYLGILIESLQIHNDGKPAKSSQAAVAHTPTPLPQLVDAWDIQIAVAFHVLNDLLAEFIAPTNDVTISAPQIPNVWRKETKILGKTVHNKADLQNVYGHIDLQRTILKPSAGALSLDLELTGSFSGDISARVLGIPLSAPFTVVPNLSEDVPVTLALNHNGMELQFDDKEITMLLEVQTRIAGQEVKFNYPLKLTTEKFLRPIHIPNFVNRSVKIPSRVAFRKVQENKEVEVGMDWRVILPETNDGLVIFRGKANLN